MKPIKNEENHKPFISSALAMFISLVGLITFGRDANSSERVPSGESLFDDNDGTALAGINLSEENSPETDDSNQLERNESNFSSQFSSNVSLGSASSLSTDEEAGLLISSRSNSELLQELNDVVLSDIGTINDILLTDISSTLASAVSFDSVNQATESSEEAQEQDSEEIETEEPEDTSDDSGDEVEYIDEALLLIGTNQDDFLFGGSGSDELRGELGNDRLNGFGNHDTLYGGEGNDELFGENGDDVLNGASGNDTLVGGEGNDVLFGGIGADILTGGDGDDIFIFSDGSDADLITDFVSGDDSIDLRGISLLNGFEELLTTATDEGDDVLLDFGHGDELTLFGVNSFSLNEDDFTFG